MQRRVRPLSGSTAQRCYPTVKDVPDHADGRQATGRWRIARWPELPCPHERPAVVTPGIPGVPGMRSAVLRSVWWWAGPLLLAATALAFDAAKRRIAFGVWTTGPVDEVAHLSTAALGLLVLIRFIEAPRRFYVAALIASVAIDLDHIPLYLGLLGDPAQRPITHSLSTAAVFTAAAAVSRRHRAVLAGAATGLVLHFARDVAEGYPGVRLFWPLQGTSWMVGYRWFLGLIVVLAAARLVLVGAGLPHTRIPVFRMPSPAGSTPRSPDGSATSGDRPGPRHEGLILKLPARRGPARRCGDRMTS
jgi:inner membrane protein